VIPSAILGRYARSLTDVVFEENIEAEVTANLKTYSEIFLAVPDLLEAFDTPAVPRETKAKLLAELLFRYPVVPVTSNFLRILLEHNRIRFFERIFEIYGDLVNERKGIVSARVTTAGPISGPEVEALRSRLGAITGKTVVLEPRTDSEILGGIIVQLGRTIYDGSIRSQLAEMKRRMAER